MLVGLMMPAFFSRIKPFSSRLGLNLIGCAPFIFLTIFFIIPLVLMLVATVRPPGEFGGLAPFVVDSKINLTLDTYQFITSDFIYAQIFVTSFNISALTTLLCLLLGYPLALMISRSSSRWQGILVFLIVLPFASNFLVKIYAWIILLEPLGLLYTSTAVVIGLVYIHLPFMVLPIYLNLMSQDPALVEAGRDLGATPIRCFFDVTLPLSFRGVLSGCALVFVPVIGVFAVPEILGGTGDILIGNVIKEQFLDGRDWPLGSTLSIVVTMAVLMITICVSIFTKHRDRS